MSTAGVTTLEQRMANVEKALAVLSEKIDNLVKHMEPRALDVENRLRALEAARWWVGGVATAAGAVIGWLGPLILNR